MGTCPRNRVPELALLMLLLRWRSRPRVRWLALKPRSASACCWASPDPRRDRRGIGERRVRGAKRWSPCDEVVRRDARRAGGLPSWRTVWSCRSPALLADRLFRPRPDAMTGGSARGLDREPIALGRGRDALLHLLRAPSPGRRCAAGERAAGGRARRHSQVPIELKKDSHRDVWSAPRGAYADPDGRLGIYLVFRLARDGQRPARRARLESGPAPCGRARIVAA